MSRLRDCLKFYFTIAGKWRLLSLDYATTVFSYFISLMEKQKWKEIKKSESKKILNTMVPEIVIDHILQHYAVQHKEGMYVNKFLIYY